FTDGRGARGTARAVAGRRGWAMGPPLVPPFRRAFGARTRSETLLSPPRRSLLNWNAKQPVRHSMTDRDGGAISSSTCFAREQHFEKTGYTPPGLLPKV